MVNSIMDKMQILFVQQKTKKKKPARKAKFKRNYYGEA
jgi:hypothetical protein